MRKILLLGFIFLLAAGCEMLTLGEDPMDHPVENFEVFWQDFDNHYAFFELKNIDWDSVYAVFRPQVKEQTTPRELFQLLSDLTLDLKDGHVSLFSPLGYVTHNFREGFPTDAPVHAGNYLERRVRVGQFIEYGEIRGEDLGYILISSFGGSASQFGRIDEVLAQLKDRKGIIIDVRSNGGGSSTNSRLIASRFADQRRLIEKVKYRNGPDHHDFTDWIEDHLEPGGPFQYLGGVVVLTNRGTYSSAEHFVLAMRVLPTVTVVGGYTGGGSGNPIIREMPNGWVVGLSNWLAVMPEGNTFEGIGLEPDVEIHISEQDSLKGEDSILEAAISILN